jgi:predicted DNA-binding transcriptional regulator AlpA
VLDSPTDLHISLSSSTLHAVKIDPAELVDTIETAAIIGLNNANGVSVYRKRFADFPQPVIAKGRCVLWRRQDVERWAASR